MDKSPVTPGTPNPPINQHRLAKAVELADAASALTSKRKHKRFWKILQGFYKGLISNEAEDRLHQFVRCIEGFIYPKTGKTGTHFKSRTELFIGTRHHPLMEQLYELRSAVEHLRDPLLDIPGASPGDKLVALFRKSYEAESLARYCIERFVSRHNLWPYFEDDTALQQFWSPSFSDREKLWGARLDIDQVSKAFIERRARIAIGNMNLILPS